MGDSIKGTLAQLYRSQYSALVAPLIRIMGSFERAEDVVQDAFAEALASWETKGLPREPVAWLRRVAKNKAIDLYRRNASWSDKAKQLADGELEAFEMPWNGCELPDDELRLLFTCCHPSLAPAAQIALTLRTVCGFTTEEAARSLLMQPTTLQQRVVRAKRKIDIANIPYVVPSLEELPSRLATVLKTVYLVFSEGYSATTGDSLIRQELCEESIRLARHLRKLLADESGPEALLALMLLHHSRSPARTDDAGDLITLEEQNRGLWDRKLIDEALPMVERCLVAKPLSSYAVEAAISALHARAQRAADTDWPQIAALYGVLLGRSGGNPVVALNAAVSVAMSGKLEEGLRRLDDLQRAGTLSTYHLLPAARGDILRRLGRVSESREAYQTALSLLSNLSERRFIERRLAELHDSSKKVEKTPSAVDSSLSSSSGQ
ncbi:MAG: RNA polymerase subunit sigma-24 [Kofleriaceae bacterium]|nr:RNA polymerase subunit sigma-24 [Kofleriaceae bacterium]